MQLLINAGIGLGAGVLRALLGWAKGTNDFDGKKFLKTAIISGVAGLCIGLVNIDPVLIFTGTLSADIGVEEGFKMLTK